MPFEILDVDNTLRTTGLSLPNTMRRKKIAAASTIQTRQAMPKVQTMRWTKIAAPLTIQTRASMAKITKINLQCREVDGSEAARRANEERAGNCLRVPRQRGAKRNSWRVESTMHEFHTENLESRKVSSSPAMY